MREPDLKDAAGRAWRCPVPELSEAEPHATLAQWLVHATGFHPLWDVWIVTLLHLRPIEGMPEPVKHYHQAAYEFMILSVNPEAGTIDTLDPDNLPKPAPFLVPIDVEQQFHGVTDKQAVAICADAVRAIVQGIMSPDQDFRAQWKASIWATVSHYSTGVHE